MRSSKELTNLFFFDLHKFNHQNFKTIETADLSNKDTIVHKAFSSVITRYFIFRDKHPELTDVEKNILYFKLKLDLIADYFSGYPDTDTSSLLAFQLELRRYVKDNYGSDEYPYSVSEEEKADSKSKEGAELNDSEQGSSLPNIELGSDNKLSVQQQQESVSVAS